MDFLESAVSVAKDVLDVACKKTDEVLTSGKQKLNVATIENKLSKDYEKLGRFYYEMIADEDTENPEIEEIKTAIVKKQQKLELLKTSMVSKRKCPVCGLPVFKNSSFCDSCGAKLEFEE